MKLWIHIVIVISAFGTPRVVQAQDRVLPRDYVARRNLEYVEDAHDLQKLDLYLPKEAAGPLPLIVWVHGGGWSGGDKANVPPLPFVAKGYAVASVNYRLSKHAVFPAQIEDCKAAIRWLRGNAKKYNLNPEKVGVWGSSAGGHLVALLGTSGDVKDLEGSKGHLDQSSRVQCVIDYFGPTDFTQMGGWHNNANSPESSLIGGPVQENKDKAAKANPITYVTKDDPPFLIVHGDKDPAVPYLQSTLLHDSLVKAKVASTLIKIEGGGHGGRDFYNADALKRVEAFFSKHLK